MALNKTFKNQDGGSSNGYYRVREVRTQYEKDKDDVMELSATFIVEVYDYDTGEPVDVLYKLSNEEGPAEFKSTTKKRITKSGYEEIPTKVWELEGAGVFSLTLSDAEPVQNLTIKAYEYLKTLPEFSEAIDC